MQRVEKCRRKILKEKGIEMYRIPESIQKVLDLYIDKCNKELPGLLDGLYVHGSIAIDAYLEGQSDIDFVAVTSRKLTNDDAAILKEIHRKLAKTCKKPQLDGIYVQSSNQDEESYFYNEGTFEKAKHDNPVTWWLLKNNGVTIFGPKVKDLPIHVTTEDLTDYVRKNMNDYWATRVMNMEKIKKQLMTYPVQHIETEMEWTVLGLLRQYYTLSEHSVISKLAAGEYGLRKLEPKWHDLIQEAMNIRKGSTERIFASNEERVNTTIHFAKELISSCNENNPTKSEVILEGYQTGHLEELIKYELTESQLTFTSHPKDALLACETDRGRHPIVILEKGKPAGFFVLYQGEELPSYTDNPNAILLRAYSVAVPFQGKGIAGKSLELLPNYVKRNFPHVDEVVLAVNVRNETAQRVYLRAGFKDSGRRVMGRMGEQYLYRIRVREEIRQ
ncbi:GNAT family N-acetyltransferase [Sutcliffiella horikoshii]|uniref:GNAT family N-acetyltransferase n=1 Tax=Sutcliffiella horikoshii TaxID=79883 RepID=A0A5D4SZU1_9BACI|nr:GNAT family N-acetyltransferase [Sutcliffiella horikoshii]TYS67858.1 GNAT family N-acetyltransferase [Sutcliffiella horikoshii]